MSHYIAAIDLGTTKVVVTLGEKTEYGIKVISIAESPVVGISRGEVVNIGEVMNSLKPLIDTVKKESGIDFKDVYVGISGQFIKSYNDINKTIRKYPDMLIEKDEIQRMEREMFKSRVGANEKILHVVPQFYKVDDRSQITSPVGMPGEQIEGNYKLFISTITPMKMAKNLVERCGLNVKKFFLGSFSSAASVLTEEEKELGVALVDFGGGTTDLLVYHDNIIRHASVTPFGGNSVTEDLKTGCNVLKRVAEQIKIQYGDCFSEFAPDNKTVTIPTSGGRDVREISFKFISYIIEARVEEIFEAVLHEIENSGYADKLSAGIVVTGGSSAMNHLVQLIHFKTGFNARVVSPSINNISPESIPEAFKATNSTAIGLLIKGFEYDNEPIYSDIYSEEKKVQAPASLFVEELVAVPTESNQNKAEKPTKKKDRKILDSIFKDLFSSNDDAA